MAAEPVGHICENHVKVDDKSMMMKVGRKPVLATSVSDGCIKLEWLDKEWRDWRELQESAELNELIGTANASLAKAASAQPKGKGKGPNIQGA